MAIDHTIPIIDLSPYLNSLSSSSKQTLIGQVKTACSRYGFFQINGHGVPLELQQRILEANRQLFALPQEEKDTFSLKNSLAKRGYERLGEQTLDKAALSDRKEGFYLGVESSQTSFMRGSNQWPDLPATDFKDPITAYHNHMLRLSATLLEILVQGLGREPSCVEALTKDPVCNLKLLHYPPSAVSKPKADGEKAQYGAGAHTDFGILTILLQQPGKIGLQVHAPGHADSTETGTWLSVPAFEDVLVVNVGDLLGKWSGGAYKSALHRVVHEGDGDRYSVPCFWQGDLSARNPFTGGEEGETVEEHVRRRFEGSYGT